MANERILKIVSLLELVAAEQLDPTTALRDWPDMDSESDQIVASGWHQLHHYETDIDIREKDPGYGEKQREGLKKQALKIREKYELFIP